MNKSIISWTNLSWNPTHGCHKISEGCRNCYAASLSLRRGWTKKPWTSANKAENVLLKPHKLREPLRVKEPSRIFVNSMSDLFHENIPDSYRRQIFDVMNQCPQHIFQILTKRPESARKWEYGWSDHIWIGTSVESEKVVPRIDHLRNCATSVKFISMEPLIGPVGLVDLTNINWVIVGGESGPNAIRRDMPHAWARAIRDQCVAAAVPFFFKQSSAYRTEIGCALHHGDGTFWKWEQWPDQLDSPSFSKPHKYAYEFVPTSTAP